MTSIQIKKLISNHKAGPGVSYTRYKRYYEGNNVTIQDKAIQAEPDNRKALAFARKAVNGVVGFIFGEVTWTYEDDPENEIIKMLNSEKGMLKESNSAETACMKGLSYKIFWQENKMLRYSVLQPDNIIVKWSDDIEPEMVEVYYYTEREEINEKGETVTYHKFWIYRADSYELWEAKDSGAYVKNEDKSGVNEAGVINIVEHYINPEKRNLFYHVIGLIDLMDEIVSTNFANEIQGIANAILAMSGYLNDQLPDEQTGETGVDKMLTGKLKVLEGIQKAQGDFAEWIVKEVQWDGILGIYDRIYKAIWELLEIPNWTDERYTQAASGRALQIMLIPFENKAKMIEKNYKDGLMKQVEIINAFPVTKNALDPEKVSVEFVRNMPEDEDKRIDNAVKVMTIAGKEAAVKYIGPNILPEQEEILERIADELASDISDILNAGNVKDEPQAEGEE
jgi:SPP1 family phage portal protein